MYRFLLYGKRIYDEKEYILIGVTIEQVQFTDLTLVQ